MQNETTKITVARCLAEVLSESLLEVEQINNKLVDAKKSANRLTGAILGDAGFILGDIDPASVSLRREATSWTLEFKRVIKEQ